jgi:WD40 repeat protein
VVAQTSDPTLKTGISTVTFNVDGSLLATKDESTPTTVWIWDLEKLTPRTILIQHAPIKSVLWHPTLSHLLLIHCLQDEQVLYIWDSRDPAPKILPVAFSKSLSRVDARWLNTIEGRKTAILIGDTSGSVVVWPEGQDTILRFESPNGTDESNDSLYEILTGKKQNPAPAERTMLFDDEDDTGVVEDTFMGKKGMGLL